MTEQQLRDARRALRVGGDPPEALLAELRRVVRGMVRNGGFPPAYAPYGVWNEEAEDDLYQGWLADRLLKEGALRALVYRARTPGALRRMAERSLRQYLLNTRARSQSQNLYERCAELLRDDPDFVVARESRRAAETWWQLAGEEDRPEWGGDDRRLLAHAWSLGDFEIVRYRADAQKLAPVLDSASLKRFVVGMFTATGCRLTLGLLVATLRMRFGLDRDDLEALDEVTGPAATGGPVDRQVALQQTVNALIAEMTARQIEVLLGTRAEETRDQMAERLGCSAATISNEQRRIAALIERHAETAEERDLLLRMLGDALYQRGEQT